jgi:hypothetical protein
VLALVRASKDAAAGCSAVGLLIQLRGDNACEA